MASPRSPSSTAGGTRDSTDDNGWAIGDREPDGDEAAQDAADAAELYRLLEEEIVPRFFERDATGLPPGWVETMRASIGARPVAVQHGADAHRVRRPALPAGRAGAGRRLIRHRSGR